MLRSNEAQYCDQNWLYEHSWKLIHPVQGGRNDGKSAVGLHDDWEPDKWKPIIEICTHFIDKCARPMDMVSYIVALTKWSILESRQAIIWTIVYND